MRTRTPLLALALWAGIASPARAEPVGPTPVLGPGNPSWMPDWLTWMFLGNPLWRWVLAAVVLVVAVLLLKLLAKLAAKGLQRMSEETRAGIKDLPLELLAKTRGWFYATVGLWLGSLFLTTSPAVGKVVGVAVTLAVFLQAGFLLTHTARELIAYAVRKRAPGRAEAVVAGVIGTLATIVVWAILLILALENLGVDVTGLVAAAGVATIGISMAAKDVFSDLFASLSIILDRPFEVGDYIVVGDKSGTVQRIGLKTTRIKSVGGEQLIFANSDLLSSRIQNFKRMDERRAVFEFGVVYGTPADKLEAVPDWVKELVDVEEKARFDRAHFTGFGASSLDFQVVFTMTVPDFAHYRDVQERLNLALYRRLEEEGVEFAFPTQTLHVETLAESSAVRRPSRPATSRSTAARSRTTKQTTAKSKSRAGAKKKPTRRKRKS